MKFIERNIFKSYLKLIKIIDKEIKILHVLVKIACPTSLDVILRENSLPEILRISTLSPVSFIGDIHE